MSGIATWYRDVDGDGWGTDSDTIESCSQPEGYVRDGGDCNDTLVAVHPTAPEVCDNLDNDCVNGFDDADPNLDLSTRTTWYVDADEDGWGDPTTAVAACLAPDSTYIAQGDDCDDDDATAFPGAAELCDGVKNDCDAASLPADEVDRDGDGFVACDVASGPGWRTTPAKQGGDCDETSEVAGRRYPGADEICDGVVDDCSGGATPANEVDNDGDLYVECTIVRAGDWQGPIDIIDGGDCDDTDPWAADGHPGATELCDGVFDDCSAGPDLPADEVDDDGDGYVECAANLAAWWRATISGGGDCIDTGPQASLAFPGASEQCNGRVDACGGTLPADEQDTDGDGYVACDLAAGPGWIGDGSPQGGDCDDTSPWAADVHPGAAELCDGVIDDCDTPTLPSDEVDDDGDGYVECTVAGISAWHGVAITGGDDCIDTGPEAKLAYPGATEACNGRIDTCGGELPDAEKDRDQDGYVACDVSVGPGWIGDGSPGGGDCDETSSWAGDVHPDADELCDGVRDNCSTGASVPTDEVDDDQDGYVECPVTDLGAWHGPPITGGDDCLDLGAQADLAYPGAPEQCNGRVDTCGGSLPANEKDQDGDGYVPCDVAGGPGWIGDGDPQGGDCDDTGPWAHYVSPAATEICDGIVNHCGSTLSSLEIDNDGDGYVECTLAAPTWRNPSIAGGGDCHDSIGTTLGIPNSQINPGETEVCDDDVDNDCDGGASACRFSGTITTPYADIHLWGRLDTQLLGESLAIGNIDGDQYDDLIIGSGSASLGPPLSSTLTPGGVTLWLGRANQPASTQWDAMLASSHPNNSSYYLYGGSVLACDVNGDGLDEMLTSYGTDFYLPINGGGWRTGTSEPRGFIDPRGTLQDSDADFTFARHAAGQSESTGMGLTWCGWIAHHPYDPSAAADLAIRNEVFYGPSVSTSQTDLDYPDATAPTYQMFTGDLDDDGYDEMITLDSSGAGAAYFIDGAASGFLSQPASAIAVGADTTVRLGSSGIVADVDGDGNADLLLAGTSGVYVFLGPLDPYGNNSSDDADAVITGSNLVLEATGDLDSDGADDTVLRDGADMRVAYGGLWPASAAADSLPTFYSGTYTYDLGVARIGDINGDGHQDPTLTVPMHMNRRKPRTGRTYPLLGFRPPCE